MTNLDARYGRTSRRGGLIGIVIAALVVVGLAAVWFIWARPIDTGPSLDWQDRGFQIKSDAEIDSSFLVTLDPGNAAQCVVEALDESFGVVGWRLIDVPASDTRIRTFDESILTTAHAVTATVHDCWLATS